MSVDRLKSMFEAVQRRRDVRGGDRCSKVRRIVRPIRAAKRAFARLPRRSAQLYGRPAHRRRHGAGSEASILNGLAPSPPPAQAFDLLERVGPLGALTHPHHVDDRDADDRDHRLVPELPERADLRGRWNWRHRG
eukprot:CAMPEP_0180012466 /NCGR_PEP_ID=MMETSP0984-20121128/16960_1 /TAXON_ID=483367 /ORGANISM="non described non described, Strain CCMP 2436" /LENGTH=134 /DNA_ID=CAMNT_0021934679 /DNA_START=113 /DNA_END=514 /DNA_ORIENTATION=-